MDIAFVQSGLAQNENTVPKWLKKSMSARSALCICASLLLPWSRVCAGDSATAPAPSWPGDFVARLEALALLETLNADLLSHDSATMTLEHWCGVHRLASPPRIVAARILGDKPPSPEQRRELGVSDWVIFDLPPALAVKRRDQFARVVHPVLQARCAR